jgi:hypothetical protein
LQFISNLIRPLSDAAFRATQLACLGICGLTCVDASAEVRVLEADMHHVRIAGPREWDTFPETAPRAKIEISFPAEANSGEQTLHLRQQDVKQSWGVWLNERQVGQLTRDENDMRICLPIPANTLKSGQNILRIEQTGGGRLTPDDIRVGQISIDPRPVSQVLSEASVSVLVTEAETGQPLPARITIVDQEGALQMVGATSNDHLAVRTGTIYTANGQARFGVPSGHYTVYAGRGCEYSLDRHELTASSGEAISMALTIRREVPTDGYVACDTHVHTLTHSGHGDATAEERMVTLAGEGIELPIATDHNVHIDHDSIARKMNVRQFFTPVIGNEVTTQVGHFNIFPLQPGTRPPDHTVKDWPSLFERLATIPDARIVILNHARDLHSGVRPFGPRRYNWLVAENLDGWPLRFNGMEVINSSATQNDVMRLFRDWMALLNRGYFVTPVGSSDSHDVARHFVGQGRTYIRCDDTDPGRIDVSRAVESFLKGSVLVSYGLLTELIVDGKFRSGDVAGVSEPGMEVTVRVSGPHWIHANQVELFANGSRVREAQIDERAAPVRRGLIWEGKWRLPKPKHDIHLVAIARGPGIDQSYWRTAKPYQPKSIDWNAQVAGCSGAVWLDGDGDGQKTPARAYAEKVFTMCGGELSAMINELSEYDQAVAAHAIHLYWTKNGPLEYSRLRDLLTNAADDVQAGFNAYFELWREIQQAQAVAAE